jgi:hypothetical protein
MVALVGELEKPKLRLLGLLAGACYLNAWTFVIDNYATFGFILQSVDIAADSVMTP